MQIGYADADGSMAEDRHMISGYTFIINGGAVSWSAKHQEIISLSTTESKYVAAAHAAKEALWLHSLIEQLFEVKLSSTTMFSNNQFAIAKYPTDLSVHVSKLCLRHCAKGIIPNLGI